MNLLDTAKQIVGGVDTLRDWIGAGGAAVSLEEAERRALICSSGDVDRDGKPAACRFNVAPNWIQENLTHPVAIQIKRIIEIKNKANLKVSSEDSLNICKCCGCALKTKVWVPMEHIDKHNVFYKLPDFCWIKD